MPLIRDLINVLERVHQSRWSTTTEEVFLSPMKLSFTEVLGVSIRGA